VWCIAAAGDVAEGAKKMIVSYHSSPVERDHMG
jgi:hypothetical protein